MSSKTSSLQEEKTKSTKQPSQKQKVIHVLSNTHWDREWRFPFEQTRLLLVDLVDRLLELMESQPEYKYYNFDSQTIFLEDYLEYRPENRKRLETLITEGRLIVGPWYTLPEEFCVGAEALVRNLLMGRRLGDSFGRTSRVGYTPTSYGQISQMPQLYSGFGIDGIIFYRGISPDECTNEYFLEGPDGSRILGIRLSRHVSRGAFFLYVSRGTMHENNFEGYHWGDEGCLPFHFCRADEDHEEEPVLIRAPYRELCNLDSIEAGVKMAMEDILPEATTDCMVLFDGMDSTAPNRNLPKILETANQVNPQWRFEHSSLPRFLEDLKSQIDPGRLTVLKGERRHPSKNNLFNAFLKDSISSRMYLKQRNAEVERSLVRWAEPFACFAWLLSNQEYPETPLLKAWKTLLACHPHDSIAGLSPDQIHKDMMFRFDQAQIIAEALAKRAIGEIVAQIDTSDAQPGDVLMTVCNPLPTTRNDVPVCFVDFPREKEYRAFSIFDNEGNKVTQQILSREDSYLIATEAVELPMPFETTKWKIAFEANAIPALGMKTFTVRPEEGKRTNHGSQVTGPTTMENEFLQVCIESDGTLTVLDKKSGESYSKLLYFEDDGDWGDPWMRMVPHADRTYSTIGSPVEIQRIDDGPVLTTFEVKIHWNLPIGIDRETKRRRKEHEALTVTSRISLKRGIPRVLIDVEVDNTVKDHRLRVLFDPGFKPEKAIVHGQFDVLERQVELPDTSDWLEPMTGTNPQYGSVSVENGRRGLSVMSFGLTEYEVKDRKDGSIALTLLRTYGYPKMSGLGREDRVVRWGNEGTQCLGRQSYSLALYFYQGKWDECGVLKQEAEHQAPTLPVHHGRYQGKGLTRSESFLKIDPDVLCLSAIKKAESGERIIVRLYNPTDQLVKGALQVRFPMEKAELLKLSEEPLENLQLKDDRTIELEVPKKKIMTIGIDFCR